MRRISFTNLLAIGLAAAFFASTVGTALLFYDELSGHPLRQMLGETGRYNPPSASEWMAYPAVWIISLFGTIPGSLLIGALAIYPFRRVISDRPLVCAIPVLAYAVLLSMLLFGWTITPTAYGAKHYEVLWFYSGSSALAFVGGLGWWGRRQRRMISDARAVAP